MVCGVHSRGGQVGVLGRGGAGKGGGEPCMRGRELCARRGLCVPAAAVHGWRQWRLYRLALVCLAHSIEIRVQLQYSCSWDS